MQENKQASISFWNEVADQWRERSYAFDGNTSVFPSSQVRNKVIKDALDKQDQKDSSLLDIGCADGQLIFDLNECGFSKMVGIDNSESMIKVARERLQARHSSFTDSNEFHVADADSLPQVGEYDVITAIGLIEYLEDLDVFFDRLADMLADQGTAFIESRNKLFNVFSANQYTVEADALEDLIQEIDEYSKDENPKEYISSLVHVLKSISSDLDEETIEHKDKSFKAFPFQLPQYTPAELGKRLGKCGLEIKDVHFYHSHLFPPKFGEIIPQLYNRIGILMQPLAKTSLGPLICSSFVLEVVKK